MWPDSLSASLATCHCPDSQLHDVAGLAEKLEAADSPENHQLTRCLLATCAVEVQPLDFSAVLDAMSAQNQVLLPDADRSRIHLLEGQA